jgi:hypothetical protein
LLSCICWLLLAQLHNQAVHLLACSMHAPDMRKQEEDQKRQAALTVLRELIAIPRSCALY